MKKVVDFLEKRGIEYEVTYFGNPYQFNYPVVDGLMVFFDCNYVDSWQDMVCFEKFMKSVHTCVAFREDCGENRYQFNVLSKYDKRRLLVHKERVIEQEKAYFNQLNHQIGAFRKVAAG